MKKKLFKSISICVLTLSAAAVIAQPPASAGETDIFTNTVTITGTASPSESLTLLVTRKQTGVNKSDVVTMAELDADGQGNFSFSFPMPEKLRDGSSAAGDYYYKIGNLKDGVIDSGNFHYDIPVTLSEGIAAIKNTSSALELAELLSTKPYMDLMKSNGVLTHEFEKLQMSEKEDVAGYIRSLAFDESSFKTSFTGPVNDKILVMRFNSGTADDIAGLLNSYDYGLTFKDNAVWGELSDEERSFICKKAVSGECNSIEDVSERIDALHGLYIIKNTAYQNLHPIVSAYAEVFDISDYDLSYLEGLSSEKRISVYRIFKSKITDTTDINNIKMLISSSINEYKSNTPGNVLSGGGGGGGGGSSSGQRVSASALGSPEMVSSPAAAENGYVKDYSDNCFDDLSDVPWAAEAINALCNTGVVRGVDERVFEPGRNITRAEYLKIVLTAFKLADHTVSDEQIFSDVKRDDWYYYYVASGVRQGVVTGDNEGNFRPNDSITREDMAQILYKASSAAYIGFQPIDENRKFYDDEENISDYAATSVKVLSAHGIINGTGNGLFEPKSLATRAQAAKMVYSLLQSVDMI